MNPGEGVLTPEPTSLVKNYLQQKACQGDPLIEKRNCWQAILIVTILLKVQVQAAVWPAFLVRLLMVYFPAAVFSLWAFTTASAISRTRFAGSGALTTPEVEEVPSPPSMTTL